jgi:hypothetical protein
LDRREFIRKTSTIVATAALAGKPARSGAEERVNAGRSVLPMNRNWRFKAEKVEGAQAPDFDDSKFERIVIPHTNISLPWHGFDVKERNAEDYSDRCLDCHRWQSCGASHVIGAGIVRMRIGCHMPMQETSAIVSTTAGRSLHTLIRSHWIKIYPRDLSGGGS